MNYLFDDNENIVSYLDKVYPVGSIYMSTNATSPTTLFGGSWSAIGQGRVLIGAGSTSDDNSVAKSFTAGSTGGEFTHTLTVDEMPNHSHGMRQSYDDFQGGRDEMVKGSVLDRYAGFNLNTTSVGGSGAHNNMQPYLAVYMWERTA